MRSNHQTLTLNQKNRFLFLKASAGQWNQILSGVVCVLGFSLIFTGMLFFTLTEFSENKKNATGMEDFEYNQPEDKYFNQCNVISCSITCDKFDLSNDLSSYLEQIYQNSMKGKTCEKNIELEMTNTIFINNTVSNNWIHNVTFRLRALSITGGLKHFAPGAFADTAFSQLDRLELSDFSLDHLQSGSFDGLGNIQFLIIKDGTISKIDDDVFKPLTLADNLDIQSSTINLTCFTGSEDLYRMQLVRIYNSKQLETVTKETFAGLRSVISLYLEKNGIKVINDYAFAGMSKLSKLYINDNNLKTLSHNIINSFLEKPLSLYLTGNPWNCVCELKWLQEDIRQNIVSDIPLCYTPSEHAYKKIIDVEIICQEEETTSLIPSTDQTVSSSTDSGSEVTTLSTTLKPPTTQTVSTSTLLSTSEPPITQTESASSYPSDESLTKPTTPKPHTTQTESTSTQLGSNTTVEATTAEVTTVKSNLTTISSTSTTNAIENDVRINCEGPQLYPFNDNKYNRKLLSAGINYIVTKQRLNFSLDNNESGKVTVNILSPLGSTDILVWFIGNLDYFGIMESSNAIGCRTILDNTVAVENLVSGETYTFCLMSSEDSKVSPLDCRALAIQMPYSMQTWLANDDKAAIVSMVSVALFVCLLVGAIVIYVIIRRNPSLLRGSKRIVMVKHRSAEVIVMPPNFKDVCETKGKEENRPTKRCSSNKRKNFRRSVSETSIMSTRSAAASYVSAVEPTAVQLLHWRLERLRGSSGGKESGSGGPLLMPPAISSLPPLPPRRPTNTALILEDESLSGTSEV